MAKNKMEDRVLETRIGNINVQTFERDGLEVISHNSLYNAVMHHESVQECPEYANDDIGYDRDGTTYDKVTRAIKINGKVYTGTGANQWATLGAEIDLNNRYNIAVNRAFDDAILKGLGLNGRFYTNEQIKDTKKKAQPKKAPKAPAVPTVPTPTAPPAPTGTIPFFEGNNLIPPEETKNTKPEGVGFPMPSVDDPDAEPTLEEAKAHKILTPGSTQGETISAAYEKYGDGFLHAFMGASKAPNAPKELIEDLKYFKVFVEAVA